MFSINHWLCDLYERYHIININDYDIIVIIKSITYTIDYVNSNTFSEFFLF